MEEVTSELVLDEWIRFGQAKMVKGITKGMEKRAACLQMRIETKVPAKLWECLLCHTNTSGFYCIVTGKAVSFLKQGGDRKPTVALARSSPLLVLILTVLWVFPLFATS